LPYLIQQCPGISGRWHETTKMPDNSQTTADIHFLRRADAAAYVTENYAFPCSRQWLAKLAVVGGGPVFRKAGRYPIYQRADLDSWAQSRIGPAQSSTSDTSRHEDLDPDLGVTEPAQKATKKETARLRASVSDRARAKAKPIR